MELLAAGSTSRKGRAPLGCRPSHAQVGADPGASLPPLDDTEVREFQRGTKTNPFGHEPAVR